MNERLKELAIQAKVEHCISHVRLEDFAELIIKECINVAVEAESIGVARLIMLHFGIKK